MGSAQNFNRAVRQSFSRTDPAAVFVKGYVLITWLTELSLEKPILDYNPSTEPYAEIAPKPRCLVTKCEKVMVKEAPKLSLEYLGDGKNSLPSNEVYFPLWLCYVSYGLK